MTREPTIEELNHRIEDETRLSLLYVYSDSCRACNPADAKAMQVMTRVDTVAVNADAVPNIWTAFGLSAVPTWLLVGKGQAFAEWPGVLQPSAVAAKVVQVIQQVEGSG
jgi:thioredoxin-like negative regulator of GroEL